MKFFKDKPKAAAFILLGIVLLASVGFMVYQQFAIPADGMTAVLSVDGVDVAKVDLYKDSEPYEVDLSEIFGVKVVLEVKDHAIRFKSSDCHDQICVHGGWLSKDMDIAVCMPNQVAVVVQPSAEVE